MKKKQMLQILAEKGPMRTEQLRAVAGLSDELFQQALDYLRFHNFLNVWSTTVGDCVEIRKRGLVVAHWPADHKSLGEPMNLGITAVYRRVAAKLANQFTQQRDAAIAQKRARIAAQRRDAEIDLLIDDARFMGVSPLSLLGNEDEDIGYKSAIGEDWPEGF